MLRLRKCATCGTERTTYSQRSVYVCSKSKCIAPRLREPRRSRKTIFVNHMQMTARRRKIQKRKGGPADVWD